MAASGMVPALHHRLLLHNLDLVAKGQIKRLIVLMPPGSAKSTYVSVVFPIWWFIQHPRSSIIAVSNTVALVENFSKQIINIIRRTSFRIGFDLRAGDVSSSNWTTSLGGEYFCVGVRGAVTGRRADLAIIDDPVKSMAEADSPRQRQHLWDWYTAELLTRLKPDGRVVLIMTRWHEQDLGGQVLDQASEEWRILRLPAIAEVDDPLGRPPGAPLWPEWEGLEALNRKKSVVGSRVWSALFQQLPVASGKKMFNGLLLNIVSRAEEHSGHPFRTIRAWDLAATAAVNGNDPDWTVGLKLSYFTSGHFLVEDVVRLREGHKRIQDLIVSTAKSDGHSVIISLPIDPGQAGKSQIGFLSSLLSGFQILSSKENGSKISRAIPVVAQLETGNISMVRGDWNKAFIDELEQFPDGGKDDQVDALSRAFNVITNIPESGRKLYIPFNSR